MPGRLDLKKYCEPVFGAGSIAISLLFSAGLAFLIRQIYFDQAYPDLVVGDLAWSGTNKTVDYAMVAVFLAGFVLCLFLINACLHLFARKTTSGPSVGRKPGELGPNAKVLFIAAIPVGWCLGAFQLRPEYLFFSAGAFLLAVFLIAVYPHFRSGLDQDDIRDIYIATVLNVVFGILAFFSVLALLAYGAGISAGLNYVVPIIAIIVLLSALYFFSQSADDLKKRLIHVLYWLQLPMPFLLLVLIPSTDTPVRPKAIFYVALVAAMIISLYSWLRRYYRWLWTKQNEHHSIESGIVGSSMVSMLVFLLRTAPSPAGDDYHFGEWVLPWQQLYEFGKLPFADLNYPHGMLHLIHGFISWLFFDGSAASFGMAGIVLLVIVVAVNYFVLSMSFGSLAGLLMMVTFPYMRIHDQKLSFIAPTLLILMHPRMLDRVMVWIAVWVLSSLMLVCYSPSTGSAFVLATVPAAIWVMVRHRGEIRRYGMHLLTGATALLAMIILSPVGRILKGLLVFLLENSRIGTVANAIAWAPTFEGFVGLIWFPVICGIFSLVWLELPKAKSIGNEQGILLGITVLSFLLALIPYGFGRIGIGLSRPGEVTIWAVYFGLTLSILAMKRNFGVNYLLIVFPLIAASLFVLNEPEGFLDLNSLYDRANGTTRMMKQIDEDLDGKELVELKEALSKLLKPGETYLDLTNHSARYFYLGYPVPVLEGAFYNAPATKTQLRMLEQIKKDPPPVVLVEGANFYFDGGSASLRTPLLYRYFVLSYVPVKYGEYILLVKPDRAQLFQSDRNPAITRLPRDGTKMNVSIDEDGLSLLDHAFPADQLDWIPVSWGRSWKSLSPLLRPVAKVDWNRPVKIYDLIESAENGTFIVNGNYGRVIFDISQLGLSGSRAGYLSFDFRVSQSSQPGTVPALLISWKSADPAPQGNNRVLFYAWSSKILVPLGSNPRWLLSEGVSELEIGLWNCAGCTCSLENIEFYERNLAAM